MGNMVFFQLVGLGVEFAMTQLVRSRLGLTGLVLLTLISVGVRAHHPRLAWWSAGLFFLLTLQLQS
ncbi:hypothetical protein [Streptomyces phaeochromogenes]